MCKEKKKAWKRHKALYAIKWSLKISTLLPNFCSHRFPEVLLFSFFDLLASFSTPLFWVSSLPTN